MNLLDALPPWLFVIVRLSFDASILALAALVLHPLLARSVPARWRVALWIVVLCRFTPLPFPESRLSLFNWMPHNGASAAVAPSLAKAALPQEAPPDVATAITALPAGESVTEGPTPTLDAPPQVPSPKASPAPAAIAWPRFAATLYACGAGIVLLRLALASIALRRTIRRARPASDLHVLALLNLARHDMKIRATLPLLLTDESTGPALVGLFRPVLLLPAHLAARLSPEELRLVFLHECAHLRRRDVLLNYFLAAVSVLHWFNPVTWLMLARVRSERELACDERVLDATAEPGAYGHVLLKLVELAGSLRSPVAVGMIESRGSFARRIRMIAGFRKRSRWTGVASAGVVALAAVGALTAPNLRAQEKPSINPTPSDNVQKPAPAMTPESIREKVSVQLKHTDLGDMQTYLQQQFADKGVVIAGYGATNTLEITASREHMQAIRQVIEKIDGAVVENDDRVRQLEAKVQQLEALVAQRPSGNSLPDSPMASRLAAEMAALQSALQEVEKAKTAYSAAQAEMEAAKRQADQDNISPEASGGIASDPQMRELSQTRAFLEIERAGLQASAKADPSAVKEIEAKLGAIDAILAKRSAELRASAVTREIEIPREKAAKARTLVDVFEKIVAEKEALVAGLTDRVHKEIEAQKARATPQPAKR